MINAVQPLETNAFYSADAQKINHRFWAYVQ